MCVEGRGEGRLSYYSLYFPFSLLNTSLALTEAFGGPVTPLGAACLAVMAAEDGAACQHVTLVTDVLYSGTHRKLGARDEPTAMIHIPWVMA